MAGGLQSGLGRRMGLHIACVLLFGGATWAEPVHWYADLFAGAYFPAGNSDAWDAIDDLYDDYRWPHGDDLSPGEDFIGPLVGIRGGLLLWDALDLSASIGYYDAEVELEKGESVARYDRYWSHRGSLKYDDKWELEIFPVNLSIGYSFLPWSIVRPYIAAGGDVYFWSLDGDYESPGDAWADGYMDEDFSSDDVDLGWHVLAGLDVGSPGWWISGFLEGRYTFVEGEVDGDLANFLGETSLDLSGWSVLIGIRFRSPDETRPVHAAPLPVSPQGVRLRARPPRI